MLIASAPNWCIDTQVKTFYVIKKSPYVPKALQPGYDGNQFHHKPAVRYKGLMGKQIKVVYNIGVAADFPYTGLLIQSKGAYEFSLNVIFPRKGNDHFSKCPYETY